MGLKNNAYVANDNRLAHFLGYDDRMGFHGFLKSVKNTPAEQSLNTGHHTKPTPNPPIMQTPSQQIPQPKFKGSGPWFGRMLLLIAIIVSAVSSLMTSSPSLRILSLTCLMGLTLIAAYTSERAHAYRQKDISILIALAACLWIMISLSQYFGLHVFKASQSSFWLICALISLMTAWALKSRLALILSIAATAFWGYMAYNGQISASPLVLTIPIIAALQVFTANNLGDGFSRRLPQFILYGWGLTALIFAFISGLTTPGFILNALTLLTGLIYLSTTHPFRVWERDRSKGLSILSWFAFMACCLASFWVWVMPSAFGASPDVLPPMIAFIWQIGLIIGGVTLAAAILFRSRRSSHTLGRRLLGGIAIFTLSASHYVIASNGAGLITENISAVYLIAAMALIGGLSVIIINKFMAAIRFDHTGAMILSLIAKMALFASYVFISHINLELLYIAAVSALLTVFALALTRRPPPRRDPNSDVYRPLTPVEFERSRAYRPSPNTGVSTAHPYPS